MPIIPVKTYYLEISKKTIKDLKEAPQKSAISPWIPSSKEYLKLYNEVGGKWGWSGRNIMSNTELKNILTSNNTKLYTISFQNEIAGFSELGINNNEVELKYFGLKPKFLGKGLGGYFLEWSIQRAWSYKPQKVSVHTCEYDHPSALNLYIKYGFSLVKEQIDQEFYTDAFLKTIE